ncbi:MAG: hypothetical protein ACRDPO_14545 [Streptosporangiaceae bacterium]
MNDDHWPAAGKPGRRAGPGTHQQSGGLAALIAASAMGLAACSGHGASSPHVASLGNSSTRGPSPVSIRGHGRGRTATRLSTGNPTRLLDQWAACMRRHGDPGQTDPTIDANKVIHIAMPANVPPELSSEAHGSTGPCSNDELAAESALRGGHPAPTGPSQVALAKYAECMRANGVPNYPDSTGSTTNFQGTGVDPNSPIAQKANDVCARKTGMPAAYITGDGVPGEVMVRGAQLPNGPGPSGGVSSGAVPSAKPGSPGPAS